MKVLLLVSNGLVGIDIALKEILKTPDCQFYLKIGDWKTHKYDSLKKNGILFSIKKYFWLKNQTSIEDIIATRTNARLYCDKIGEFEPAKDTILISIGWHKKILKKTYSKFKQALNVHPSLLPKYKGQNPIKRAIEAGDKIGGATLHELSEKFDSGKIIRQSLVAYQEGYEPLTLKECYQNTMSAIGKMVSKYLIKQTRAKVA